MIETLKILRQAGFFKDYNHLSDIEILNMIYERRKKLYSKIFGYDYDPGMDLSDQQLAMQDSKKMLYLDLEADVCAQNKVYSELLQGLDKISGRQNLITDTIEEWEGETGPVKVSYKINGELRQYSLEYNDDWVDQKFIEVTLTEITQVTQERFHLCLGPDLEWFGQDVNYIRLTQEERAILEEKLHWKFFEDFLREMRK